MTIVPVHATEGTNELGAGRLVFNGEKLALAWIGREPGEPNHAIYFRTFDMELNPLQPTTRLNGPTEGQTMALGQELDIRGTNAQQSAAPARIGKALEGERRQRAINARCGSRSRRCGRGGLGGWLRRKLLASLLEKVPQVSAKSELPG